MTSVEQALVAHLGANPTVTALGAVYPRFRAPSDGQLPYTTYLRISGVPEIHQGGDAELTLSRFQLDCWASHQEEAEALFDAVTDAMDLQNATMGAGVYTVPVDRSRLENTRDEWADPTDGTQGGTARVTADFMIWHRT